MKIKVEKKSILDIAADVIVVNLFDGVKCPGGVTGIVDEAFDNLISNYVIKQEKFSGKFGEIYTLPLINEKKKILVVGLGEVKDFTPAKIRTLSAKVIRACETIKNAKKVVSILHGAGIGGLCPEACAQMMAEGLISGTYSFDKYKSDKTEKNIKEFIIAEIDNDKFKKAKKGVEKGLIIADAVNMARDLINEPAQNIYPETLADYAVKIQM